ncbi:MAG: hypothetical protein ACKO8N_17395 [Rubrivivax sp.]
MLETVVMEPLCLPPASELTRRPRRRDGSCVELLQHRLDRVKRPNPEFDAAVAVQRLLDAGAVVFGETNEPAALADWQSVNPIPGIPGICGDPWDRSRNPAHCCGVWGHKPTWGVVPLEGHLLPGDVCADRTDIGASFADPVCLRLARGLETECRGFVAPPMALH